MRRFSTSSRSSRRTLLGAATLSLLAGLAATRSADAAQPINAVQATYIYRQDVVLTSGTYVFATQNLSAGGDTVMDLWGPGVNCTVDGSGIPHCAYSGATTSLANNDDDATAAAGTRSSRFEYTVNPFAGNASGVKFTLIIRSYAPLTTGTMDVLLYKKGAAPVTLEAGAPFGGSAVGVATGSLMYETALAPGGTSDTVLLAASAQGGPVLAFDDDTGVGRASAIDGAHLGGPSPMVIVGSYNRPGVAATSGGPGATTLYVNDYTTDTPCTNRAQRDTVEGACVDGDGDGLGEQLERALGTCNSRSAPGCDAAHVVRLWDMDRDGLSDDAEVFGIDDPTAPQLLSAWGANPRHKDIFIENQWLNSANGTAGFAAQPMDRNDVVWARAMYGAAPAAVVANPDGVNGISLHFDLGVATQAGDDPTTYGDWGGARGLTVHDRFAAYNALPASRRGAFHLAVTSNADGGGNGDQPGVTFDWGKRAGNPMANVLAHELGHNTGLAHSGAPTWGDLNCKPNYFSVMNYAFTYTPPPDAPSVTLPSGTIIKYTPFSTAAGSTLNAAAVPEHNSFPAGVPSQFTSPLYGYQFPAIVEPGAVLATGLDWNRDGIFAPAGVPVRVPINEEIGGFDDNGCDSRTQLAQQMTSKGAGGAATPVPSAHPSITRVGGYVYLGSQESDGTIVVKSAHHTGVDSHGSCPNGDTQGSTCNQQLVNAPWNNVVVPASGHSILGFSMAPWGVSTLVIAYLDRDNVKNTTTVHVITGTTDPNNGLVWAADKVLTRGGVAVTSDIVPELSTTFANAADFGLGSSRVLGLYYATGGSYRAMVTTTPAGTWSSPALADPQDVAGKPIPAGTVVGAATGAAVTSWPSDGWSTDVSTFGSACGAFTDATATVHMYCRDRATGKWKNMDANFAGGPPKTTSRPGIAFHVPRTSVGSPVVGDVGTGQIYLTTSAAGGAKQTMQGLWQWNIGGSGTPPVTSTHPITRLSGLGNQWAQFGASDGTPHGGVAMLEDGGLGAMEAVYVVHPGGNFANAPQVSWAPLFDGGIDQPLSTGNDFSIMERGVCQGLHAGYAFCGSPSTSIAGF